MRDWRHAILVVGSGDGLKVKCRDALSACELRRGGV